MESIKVKDLMLSLDQYVTISEDATIYEAILALKEARDKYVAKGYPHRAVIVRDKAGKAVGKLGQLDVLRNLEPKYGELADLHKVSGHGLGAEFLKNMLEKWDLWQAPLEDICRKAADVKVGGLARTPLENEVIDQDASLNQAVHQLIMGHHQSLLVTSKGEIVGILRLTDVFHEVSDRIVACKI